MEADEDRLNSFMGKMIGDVGAAMSASLMLLGDKLGRYKALAKGGPMDPVALANGHERTLHPGMAVRASGLRLRRIR
jgi:hypothetical protein